MIENFLLVVKEEWNLLLSELKKEALENLKNNICEIDFENESIKNLPSNLNFGIYLFTIKPNIGFCTSDFQKNWKSTDAPKKTPKISLMRFSIRDDSKKSFNFYIGKSENLSKRIKEHCFQKVNSSTYGLKLCHREQLIQNATFTVSYFEICKSDYGDEKTKDIIQFIMTNLEKELRNEFNPWIGKQ